MRPRRSESHWAPASREVGADLPVEIAVRSCRGAGPSMSDICDEAASCGMVARAAMGRCSKWAVPCALCDKHHASCRDVFNRQFKGYSLGLTFPHSIRTGGGADARSTVSRDGRVARPNGSDFPGRPPC